MKKQKTRQQIRKFILILSFLLFPITINFFSPYLIIDGAIAGIIAGSFITFSIMFLSSLIFGRFICGWLCPGGGIGEICFQVQNKPVKGTKVNLIKYFIWIPWISVIAFFLIQNIGIISINFLHKTESGVSMEEPGRFIIYYGIILIFIVLSLAIGKRGGCHSICWMAPFMIIGRKIRNIFRWPSLQLKADSSKCTDCKLCNTNCPMSLSVNSMVHSESMENSECILCGACVDICPNSVIKFNFGTKKQAVQNKRL